jgi:hypothetical protein
MNKVVLYRVQSGKGKELRPHDLTIKEEKSRSNSSPKRASKGATSWTFCAMGRGPGFVWLLLADSAGAAGLAANRIWEISGPGDCFGAR